MDTNAQNLKLKIKTSWRERYVWC